MSQPSPIPAPLPDFDASQLREGEPIQWPSGAPDPVPALPALADPKASRAAGYGESSGAEGGAKSIPVTASLKDILQTEVRLMTRRAALMARTDEGLAEFLAEEAAFISVILGDVPEDRLTRVLEGIGYFPEDKGPDPDPELTAAMLKYIALEARHGRAEAAREEAAWTETKAEDMQAPPGETLVEGMEKVQAMDMHPDTRALMDAAIEAQKKGGAAS